MIPENIINKELYKKAKKKADETYKRHSLFKSAYIQKVYKNLGGKYKGKKPNKQTGINRWLKGEEWVEVIPYLKGKKIKCGTSERKGKACRPLKKVNENTPETLPSLIKKCGRSNIKKLAKEKVNNMDKYINWSKCGKK